MDLGLKESPKNFFYNIKNKLSLERTKLETKNFLKNPYTWATLVIPFTMIGIQLYLFYTNSSQLPNKIPIYPFYNSVQKQIAPNEYLLIYPTISILILVTSTIFSSKYFHKERELSKLLQLCSSLAILSIMLVFLKLVTEY